MAVRQRSIIVRILQPITHYRVYMDKNKYLGYTVTSPSCYPENHAIASNRSDVKYSFFLVLLVSAL